MTSIVSTNGKNVILNRAYLGTPTLSQPSKFMVGISQTTPVVTDTALDVAIPISDGTTCDDGSNTLTGSSGGDNSTENTTTFKQGGGNSDATAQNLIANDTNATKLWTIADLDTAGSDATAAQYIGCWIYIINAAALAKFKTSGTCLEIRVGSDTSNYYAIEYTAADLAVGWNWVTGNTTALEDLTETGTVSGDLDTFQIAIITNNATDEFAEGDIVYDLLRQWEATDLTQNIETGWPTFNLTDSTVTIRGELTSVQANGFDLDGAALFNTDSPDLLTDEDDYTSESKSDTDEIVYIWVNQLT